MFQEGQLIGPYRLVNLIGRGGFGEVWLAVRQTSLLTTKVAVKLPLDDQIDIDAIKREAALWEHASGHSNVLPIIEANIYNDQVVIVSEYASGGSLADLLKERKLSVQEAVDMIFGILAGLEFLHSKQIVHRDLKPANVLLQGQTPRLADFGISRVLLTTQTIQSVNVTGTPPYMAPEAFDGKRNVQTDIWSVGVIFYYLLSGNLPFPQQDVTSLIGAIVSRNPDNLPSSTPNSIGKVIGKALEKNPVQRFLSAGEMRNALKAVSNLASSPHFRSLEAEDDELPTQVRQGNHSTDTIEPNKSNDDKFVTVSDIGPERESKKRTNAFFISTLVLIILAVGGIGFLYFFQWLANSNNLSSQKIEQTPLPTTPSSVPTRSSSVAGATNLLPSPTPRQGNLSDSSTVPAGRESGVISVNEAAATQTLDQIRTFQAQYAAKNRGKFASFNELIRSVGLDIKFAGDHPVVNGYVFKMTVEDSADTKLAAYYKLTAEPLVNTGVTATGKRYFYTDSSISTIKVSQDGPATAHSPSL